MPIPTPILDDRSYQQLRDELVRRIPVYAPEWTDHTPGDPGIALLELFAFLGENLLFRFNQIPEATKLAFLRLLRVPVRPATPSRCLLALTTNVGGGGLVPVGSDFRAGSLPFRGRTECHVWPVTALAVAKRTAAAPDPVTEPDVAAFAANTLDALGRLQPGQQAAWFEARPLDRTGSGPPVDFSATVDRTLWVAILADERTPLDAAALAGKPFNLGFVPDPVVPRAADVRPCPGGAGAAAAVRVEWHAYRGDVAGAPDFQRLRLDGDTTDGLTREGVVRLRLPDPLTPAASPIDPALAGTGDRPPPLDDPELAKRLLLWLRAFRVLPGGAGPADALGIGRVLDVCANAIEAEQAAAGPVQFLGTGTGQPDQQFRLANRPVLAGSLVVEVEEAGGWKPWRETDRLFAAAADERVYSLDRDAGEVRFGTGLRGRTPMPGERVRASRYETGGGAVSNVPAGAVAKVFQIPAPGDAAAITGVTNRQRAAGGADAETIEAALARIPGEVRRRDRAVTADDFRELALETPGADVIRAECLPRFDPTARQAERPGVVTVVVWPRDDPRHPTAPSPDRGTLAAVCRWLDARRLVTTELYVVPPTYRKVAVSVGLRVKPGYGTEAVRRWVELVLRQYLSPVPPFGPGGGGWPLGRRVHGPELEAAALQVEGVEYLEGLTVGARDGSGYVEGTVELAVDEVPELEAIAVAVGPPDALGSLPTPPAAGTPVPVPVAREVC